MKGCRAAIWPHLHATITWWPGHTTAICLSRVDRNGKFHPWWPNIYRPADPCPPADVSHG